uniref:Enoyl reductase (ER) domain-containing protein n=1 Tax=Bionectria ochroleuca TaxID=29856 RepID=A0A8H7KA80_BIOOC
MTSENIAAVLSTKQGQIEIAKRPIPTPKADEILVHNKAIAGNPVDWMVRDYGFGITEYPTVLGSDVAGVVEHVGADVTRFKVGDRVLGFAGVLATSNADHGAWQTYTVLKEHAATVLPSAMAFEDAAAFPMAMATSINAFFVQFGLPRPANTHSIIFSPGTECLFIWGGGGAVAASMIQLAKAVGFTVYTTASPKHHDRLRRLGAAEVFDYEDANVVNKVLDKVSSAGLHLSHAIDNTSKKDTLLATSEILVRSGGPSSKLVTLLDWPEDMPCPVQKFSFFAFTTFAEHADLAGWFFNDWLAEALAETVIVPAPPVVIVDGGIGSVIKVLDHIKAGVNGVKVVILVK